MLLEQPSGIGRHQAHGRSTDANPPGLPSRLIVYSPHDDYAVTVPFDGKLGYTFANTATNRSQNSVLRVT